MERERQERERQERERIERERLERERERQLSLERLRVHDAERKSPARNDESGKYIHCFEGLRFKMRFNEIRL